MRVKKFEAKSMKEALHMVKQELGPDAVILSARDNRKSFGLGGQASVEITAAVSESTLQKKKFAESRLPQQQREQFAASGARQQRLMIDKMVEKRVRRNEEEASQAAVRKPITKTSYIDIPDDVEESPRRSNAFASAAGRSVDDLLLDFDQALMSPEEFAQAELVARAKAVRLQGARASVRNAALAARTQVAAVEAPLRRASGEETGGGIAEGALARIRSAARDAWKNNPFTDETPARSLAQNRVTQTAQPTRVATQPRTPLPLRSTGAQGPQSTSNASSPKSLGGLEIVDDADQFEQVQITKARAPAPNAQPNEVAKLHGEIARLEKMLEGFHKVPQTFATMHPGADYGISYDYSFMYQKLAEAGIATELIVEILKAAEKEIDPVQAKKKPMIDAWVARWFLTQTKTQPALSSTAGRLHLFVGGTGSGKTTSLIKMAAQLVVKEKKTVAILSTDSSKVGAVDQMKIYCQILNVPFAVIRNKQDWEWVFSQLRNIDHILVDFPGTQLREIDEIHHLKSLLPPEGFAPITHLCISATSKDGDADELARRYKVAEPNDLIFTNLDQSVQHGLIYNMQRRTGLPLHSFGIGNRIPEDFEAASKERVLDLIFKLTKLRRETT